jgi:hypothetical protein
VCPGLVSVDVLSGPDPGSPNVQVIPVTENPAEEQVAATVEIAGGEKDAVKQLTAAFTVYVNGGGGVFKKLVIKFGKPKLFVRGAVDCPRST